MRVAKPLAQGMINYLWSSKVDLTIFEMCRKYKATPSQLALAWLLSKKYYFIWVKSINKSHIMENLAAMDLKLDPMDNKILDNWKYKG